jgi:hypothetical protein
VWIGKLGNAEGAFKALQTRRDGEALINSRTKSNQVYTLQLANLWEGVGLNGIEFF